MRSLWTPWSRPPRGGPGGCSRSFIRSTAPCRGPGLAAGWDLLFLEYADLYLKVLDSLWSEGELLARGIHRIMSDRGLTRGRVLELFCGNGRVAVPLAAMGHKVVGVDFSFKFIEEAKKSARGVGVQERTEFIVGDARRIDDVVGSGSGQFDAVLIVWNSLGYYDRRSDEEILARSRRLVSEGSLLILANLPHRDQMVSRGRVVRTFGRYGDLLILEDMEFDPVRSVLSTRMYLLLDEGAGYVRRAGEVYSEMRIYTPTELGEIMERTGWSLESVYGDVKRLEKFDPARSPLTMVARAVTPS